VKTVGIDQKTRSRLDDRSRSSLAKYQEFVVGREGILALLRHEAVTSLFGNFPGGLGFILRGRFYRSLLRQMGKGVILGRSVSLRCPHRIHLGERVGIDDGCLIDARGSGEAGVVIGEEVIIGRHCSIQAKYGPIRIGRGTNIGPFCVMSAISEIVLGKHLAIAAHCYIGGGFYHADRIDIPMLEQGIYSKGPVIIEDDVWLGAGTVVLDNVRIGKGCIVGAGSVVTRDLPEFTVSVGVPARVKRRREQTRSDKGRPAKTP
jgi:acetyltransferase-like isoleucine patch superfamily enzyme